MSDVVKKESTEVTTIDVKLETVNGNVPLDFYSNNPCLVGYSYIRFNVGGTIVPCCIAKHSIGDAYKQDWRDVWHSGAYENFRKKMAKIHVEQYHLSDPEWSFCQQCSHLDLNVDKNELLKKP